MSRLSASVGFSPMRWNGARKMPNFIPLWAMRTEISFGVSLDSTRECPLRRRARQYYPSAHCPPGRRTAHEALPLVSPRARRRWMLGIEVTLKAPIGILRSTPDQVYFAKVDDDDRPYAGRTIYSNYAK